MLLHTPSSVGAWALKRKMPPGALTKGGVGIRRTKMNASACPGHHQGIRPGFAITFGGGPFVSDLAENRSETVSDLSENRSETKVGGTRPGQEPKENS